MSFEVNNFRQHFPILKDHMHGLPLHYFDSAATSLKPKHVIDAITNYMAHASVNIHRGVFKLADDMTVKYENSRDLVQKFINAKHREEIIFTKGTTESLNLIARTYGEDNLVEGDEVLITELEHHSNIVPWQLLSNRKKTALRVAKIDPKTTQVDLEHFKSKITAKSKIVSFTASSNTLGTKPPIKEMIKIVRENSKAVIIIDGAQYVPHGFTDVQDLDCDFMAFSGHKMLGPTGVGVLYGKKHLLEKMSPFLGGGDMIDEVTFEKTTYNDLPYKFEAGTPAIAEVIGLGAAIEFMNGLDFKGLIQYEKTLTDYLYEQFKTIPRLQIKSRSPQRSSVLTFTVDQIHTQDLGQYLDHKGIALRTGHMCTQPLMKVLECSTVARVSLGAYNTKEEIDYLAQNMKKAISFFEDQL